MPFLFKIVGIVVGIIIWKTVVASFKKAKDAMDEDHDENADEPEVGEKPVPQTPHNQEEQWRQAAELISCTFDPGKEQHGNGAAITGRFSGHAITVKRFGRNYVRYFVGFRRILPTSVAVVRDQETIAERLLDGRPVYPSKMFFQSKEPMFYCSAESEEAFDQFLSVPSNRSAVLNLVHLFPSCIFSLEGLSVRLRASTPDITVINQLIAIANVLENPSNTPMSDLTRASVDSTAGNIPLPSAKASTVSTKTTKIPLPKTDTPASCRTTVIRISPEAKRTGGVDTLKASVVQNSPETPPTAKSQAETTPDPVPESSGQADSLSVESVCTVLFSKPFPGPNEHAAFDAMKGQRVSWSGELQTVLPFSMDFVFGTQKGIKASFLIHRIAHSRFSSPVQIKAVAAFPPELQSALETAKGKTVEFEGELLKFEPFAHELYLRDASLKS